MTPLETAIHHCAQMIYLDSHASDFVVEQAEETIRAELAPFLSHLSAPTLPFCPVTDWSEPIQAFRELLSACVHAELDTENAGVIRALCELVLAAHRQAAATEQLRDQLVDLNRHIRTSLPSAK